jgi:hypothetical protein
VSEEHSCSSRTHICAASSGAEPSGARSSGTALCNEHEAVGQSRPSKRKQFRDHEILAGRCRAAAKIAHIYRPGKQSGSTALSRTKGISFAPSWKWS